jgi:hypothetical protein
MMRVGIVISTSRAIIRAILSYATQAFQQHVEHAFETELGANALFDLFVHGRVGCGEW